MNGHKKISEKLDKSLIKWIEDRIWYKQNMKISDCIDAANIKIEDELLMKYQELLILYDTYNLRYYKEIIKVNKDIVKYNKNKEHRKNAIEWLNMQDKDKNIKDILIKTKNHIL